MTVFVYSQAKYATPGEIHRQGLGRLTMFAAGVMLMPREEDVQIMMPTMKSETKQLSGGALPSVPKINELRHADAKELAIAV